MKNLYEVCMIHSMKALELSISKMAYVSICRAFTAIGRKHFGVRNDWTRSVLHRGRTSLAAISQLTNSHCLSPL